MVLGNFPVPGRPTTWMIVGQGPIALAVGAGGACLDIFTLLYPFSPLSPSLWETARYRLKFCLKGPLNPNQPTNWLQHILFRKISMYNIYCDNINTIGYERKQNAFIVLLLYIWSCKHTAAKDLLNQQKGKQKYVDGPGIEHRTSGASVRRVTDALAAWPNVLNHCRSSGKVLA